MAAITPPEEAPDPERYEIPKPLDQHAMKKRMIVFERPPMIPCAVSKIIKTILSKSGAALCECWFL